MLLQKHPINVQSLGLSTLLAASTDAKLHITQLLTLADDDMIKQFDPQDFAGFVDSIGHPDVFLAGRWVTRGVTMRKHNRRRIAEDGRAKASEGVARR